MSISTEEVNRIAKLARLEFNEDEKQKLQQELSSILEYVDQLSEVNTGERAIVSEDPSGINLMRSDVVEEVENPEVFLSQAPDRQGNFIKVKSVM